MRDSTDDDTTGIKETNVLYFLWTVTLQCVVSDVTLKTCYGINVKTNVIIFVKLHLRYTATLNNTRGHLYVHLDNFLRFVMQKKQDFKMQYRQCREQKNDCSSMQHCKVSGQFWLPMLHINVP